MEKEQGLKTLGDYRKAAKESLFSSTVHPKSNSTSPHDAIKTALDCIRGLVNFACTVHLQTDPWVPIWFPDSEYAMKNLQLFYAIKLMKFAVTYKEAKSVYDLYPKWLRRPDANISIFTYAGLSYLEAAFDFVQRQWGIQIIRALESTYKEHRKKGRIIYGETFKFLTNTPEINDLKINPVPDIIIKTWFDDIVEGTQRWIEENNLSEREIKKEFNQIEKQLEYEYQGWKNGNGREMNQPQEKGGQSKTTNRKNKKKDIKKRFRFNKAQAFVNGKDIGLPTGAEINPVEILKKLVESFGEVVPYKDLDENSCDTASDFLRGKIRTINKALRKHKVPCKITYKKWNGYILNNP